MESIILKGKFSVLFPKTFSYARKYVKVRHPELEYIDAPFLIIHNPEVKIPGRGSLFEVILYLPALLNRITKSEKVHQELLNNKSLLCKVLDTRPQSVEVMLHEYEHFLSDYESLKDKKSGTLGIRAASKRTFIEMRIRDYVSKSKSVRKYLKIYEVTASQNRHIRYAFSINEIISRFSSMVYEFYTGKNPNTDNIFEIDLEKIPIHIDYLKNGIKEQESLRNESNGQIIDERVSLMSGKIWYYKQILRLVPLMLKEARIISEQIKIEEAKGAFR